MQTGDQGSETAEDESDTKLNFTGAHYTTLDKDDSDVHFHTANGQVLKFKNALPCTDKNSKCLEYAKLAYCTSQWKSWMATNCAKSCFAGPACPAPQATWILAPAGKSCTEACESTGKSCSDIHLYSVVTAARVQDVAGKAGATCRNSVSWANNFNPSISGSGSSTGWCTFGNNGKRSCSEKADSQYSRLCPCF